TCEGPRMRTLGLLVIAILATSHAARAEGETDKHVTIMLAPLRGIVPLVELTGEYAITQKMGVSIEVGGGQRGVSLNNDTATGTEIEGGAQFRYYVLGSFRHGMELGAE